MNAERRREHVEKLRENGILNEWCSNYLIEVCDDGFDRELWKETVLDMVLASKLGVDTEKEFKDFFYIDNFAEEVFTDLFGIKLDEQEESRLKAHMFSLRKELDFSNMDSFPEALIKWIEKDLPDSKGLLCRAYPNHSNFSNKLPEYNLARWDELVSMVRKAASIGISKHRALKEAASTLRGAEKYDFLAWFQLKESKNIYDVNRSIKEQSKGVFTMSNNNKKMASIFEDGGAYYLPKVKVVQDTPAKELPSVSEQKEKEFSVARSKMVSRTFSIDKILEKYREVFDDDQLEEIEDALNNLRKKVRRLKLAEAIQDSFHKAASQLDKHGFYEGAEQLKKIASMKPDRIIKNAIDEADSGDLEEVLNILYIASDSLKRRDIVRQLATIDLKLYEMNIAGFFPELTDAQSKLIDAYSYASNKVQDIIPKLRSGVVQGGGVSINLTDADDRDMTQRLQQNIVAPEEGEVNKDILPKEEVVKDMKDMSKPAPVEKAPEVEPKPAPGAPE